MRCLYPRNVGFKSDGKTIAWSPKNLSKEYPKFQLPCGKCIECRLDYSKNWAVRATHEAQLYRNNVFITLTYNEENIGNNKLDYRDFQLFIKRLRETVDEKLSYMVCGEYGSKTKRMHWHAIIFNYRPKDAIPHYKTELGDQVYTSHALTELWGKGNTEFGSVTFKSAAYVARYATKQLEHGNDSEHSFKPIFKTSRHRAIGKAWLEKYYKDIFNYGSVILSGGKKTSIPRYYEKWMQKFHFEEYISYLTKVKHPKIIKAEEKSDELNQKFLTEKHEYQLINPLGQMQTEIKSKRELAKARLSLLKQFQKD